eukprot:6836559-Pyramimonas_sp.AAC.1
MGTHPGASAQPKLKFKHTHALEQWVVCNSTLHTVLASLMPTKKTASLKVAVAWFLTELRERYARCLIHLARYIDLYVACKQMGHVENTISREEYFVIKRRIKITL